MNMDDDCKLKLVNKIKSLINVYAGLDIKKVESNAEDSCSFFVLIQTEKDVKKLKIVVEEDNI